MTNRLQSVCYYLARLAENHKECRSLYKVDQMKIGYDLDLAVGFLAENSGVVVQIGVQIEGIPYHPVMS